MCVWSWRVRSCISVSRVPINPAQSFVKAALILVDGAILTRHSRWYKLARELSTPKTCSGRDLARVCALEPLAGGTRSIAAGGAERVEDTAEDDPVAGVKAREVGRIEIAGFREPCLRRLPGVVGGRALACGQGDRLEDGGIPALARRPRDERSRRRGRRRWRRWRRRRWWWWRRRLDRPGGRRLGAGRRCLGRLGPRRLGRLGPRGLGRPGLRGSCYGGRLARGRRD